jgi:hypothetical protein
VSGETESFQSPLPADLAALRTSLSAPPEPEKTNRRKV